MVSGGNSFKPVDVCDFQGPGDTKPHTLYIDELTKTCLNVVSGMHRQPLSKLIAEGERRGITFSKWRNGYDEYAPET